MSWITTSIGGIPGWFAGIILNFFWGKAVAEVKKIETTATSDAAIDAHAKEVTQEMENTHDPTKMDQADGDLLSGR